jgi:hypothetical protein
MKKMVLQEAVDWAAIPYAAFALLRVVHPVLAGILRLGRQSSVDSLPIDF